VPSPPRPLLWAPLTALLLAVTATALVSAGRRLLAEDLDRPFSLRESGWVGSPTCLSCHPDQHASWHRTFHRNMTQEAGPQSVVGAFDGREIVHQGVVARPEERAGRYFIDFEEPSTGSFTRFEIVRTVGSRRYQQYVARYPEDGNDYRLPILWHIGDRRWVHLSGAFLGPDGEGYWSHYSAWNANCIFCHNTGPRPGFLNYDELKARERRGEPVSFERDARFASEVAELGIACEACHGPGAEHARRNRNPLRRYLLHLSERRDPTIVHPQELSHDRQVDLCGQCHGQRTGHSAADVVRWLEEGPTFRPGDRLQDHVRPVWQDTTVPPGADPDLFRLRFWGDDTPRLTAYEYQGLLQSPCFQRGELSCLSCHTMHDGDVFGQLPAEMRTHHACTSCHAEIAANIPGHTGHRIDSTGSDCYACHMPKMVYGIMEIHRSHRVESPNAARDVEAGRPHACTSCHLDRSPVWSAQVSGETWGAEHGRLPESRGDGADPEIVDVVASLLAGDPVQRAVAARMPELGNDPLEPLQRAFLIPHLLLAMEDDYPAVRRFASQTLATLSEELAQTGFDPGLIVPLAAFDFLAPGDHRNALLVELWRLWRSADRQLLPPPPPGALLDARLEPLPEEIQELRRLAREGSKQIHIGE
jgi:hypothetical protein